MPTFIAVPCPHCHRDQVRVICPPPLMACWAWVWRGK